VGELWLAPTPALAQETPQPATTNSAANATVGPSELQNFSLSGSVSKPNDQQAPAPATKPAQSPPTAQREAPVSPRIRPTAQDRSAVHQLTASTPSPAPAEVAKVAPQPAAPAPPLNALPVQAEQPAPGPAISQQSAAPAATLAPEHRLSILPWLLAALVLAGGTIFLLWLRRPREALAAPEFELSLPETAPEQAPQTVPAALRAPVPDSLTRAAAPRKPGASSSGIVASRLRPSLELGVQPLRCVVEEGQVTIEFEIELFNAGTAPARAVLAEASLLNAGATQDQELAAFFANPVGAGERLDAIPPMRRINLTSRVVAPRGAIQEYELAGRKAFVPVIAFNALYEWSGGKAQTSAAYLVGRDTRSEKLGPLHLDQGSRAFTTLAARELPAMVRT
jgi:hypothetical protein